MLHEHSTVTKAQNRAMLQALANQSPPPPPPPPGAGAVSSAGASGGSAGRLPPSQQQPQPPAPPPPTGQVTTRKKSAQDLLAQLAQMYSTKPQEVMEIHRTTRGVASDAEAKQSKLQKRSLLEQAIRRNMHADRKRLPTEDQAEVKPSFPPPPPPPPSAPAINKKVKQEVLPPEVQQFNIGDKKSINMNKVVEQIQAMRSSRRIGVVQGRPIKNPSGTAVIGNVLSKVMDWSDS